jgi:hypothetical protein
MTDDGLEPVDVTGRWVGFYRQRWDQLGAYPIVADIQQIGNKITGKMYDQITDQSANLDDFVENVGEQLPIDLRRQVEQVIEQFGTETVHNSRLPDTSDIQGAIKGCQVQFTKTYRGTMEITLTVGENEVGSLRREGHKVQYAGHVDRERICIVGRWTIRKWGLLGRFLSPQAWGSFELYRKS